MAPRPPKPRRLITVADDFGLTTTINEAVEQAASAGILTSASLMVAGPAAADAVRRAKNLPNLHVGLHLVVIEGPAIMPPNKIAELVDDTGHFPTDQLALGLKYAFNSRAKRQLVTEIRAQFSAFAATGLKLDHANAHKHMHLHPFIGRLMIKIGREFGLRAIRIPYEPPGPDAELGDRLLALWTRVLRRQANRAGLVTNDRIAGLAHTGQMTPDVVRDLMEELQPGLTEMYFHPATNSDGALRRLMPEYLHAQELQALLTAQLPADVQLTHYGACEKPSTKRKKLLFLKKKKQKDF